MSVVENNPPFGLACVHATLRGGIIGVPVGIAAFVLVAPFQNHTWPGYLDTSVPYGGGFGLAGGAVLGGIFVGAGYLGSRSWRQVGRVLAAPIALLMATVFALTVSVLRDRELPHPNTILRILEGGGPRGFGTEAFLVATFALGGSLLIAGTRVEQGEASSWEVVSRIVVSFTGFTAIALLVRGHVDGSGAVLIFAAVLGFLVLSGIRATRPLSPWIRRALDQ